MNLIGRNPHAVVTHFGPHGFDRETDAATNDEHTVLGQEDMDYHFNESVDYSRHRASVDSGMPIIARSLNTRSQRRRSSRR